MQTDWLMGLAGGVLIGTAAAILLLINGRVMGASGIIGGLVDRSGRQDWQDRLALTAGLFLAPALMVNFIGEAQTNLTENGTVLIVAGLLVGVGTRLANGCTSGHGVCGISRLSLRGIIATAFYIGAGALTVVLFKHALGVI